MMFKRLVYFFTILIFFTACSNTKYLAADQNLYVGSKIKFNASPQIKKGTRKDLEEELRTLIRPKPNSKILGVRFRLWVYNAVGTPKREKGGLRNWIRNKIGEPPEIASVPVLEKSRAVMQNRLENKGYFHDTVTFDTVVKDKKLTSIYTATFGEQYKIRNVTFPQDSSALSDQIRVATRRRGSLLKPTQPYELDIIKLERERLDARLKEHGFFYFNPDYLIAKVDSTVGEHKVDIDVRVKPETPLQAREVYRIKDVVVYADYDINTDTNLAHLNTKHFQGYTIIDPDNKFQPKIFARTLVFKPGDIYNRNDHNLSLNRLTTLGVYKFVKARFERVDTVAGNYLNAVYYLTPTEKKSIRLEVTALNRSNNTTGTEVSLNWRNRNLLKGAELFTASVYGGYEKQIYGRQNINTRRLGTDLNMYIPRVIAPFKFQTSSAFVPKTRFNLGVELYNRSRQYTLTSFRGSTGYQWKESIEKEHQLNVININYVQPANITPEFADSIKRNIPLARSIERQFVLGSVYNYNYNTQVVPNFKRNNVYFNGNLDLSGNILGWITGANINKGKEKDLFGTPFSQYTRAEVDFRHYLTLGRFNSFNTRLLGGIGYAYGNSNRIPFIKSFFAGGTNDIRAFRARSLGPGSFYQGRFDTLKYYVDQPGDIKMEASVEYRAKLFSIVRYALFADAGNIWTRKEDSARPGSKFSSKFLSQVALGAGAGLRFDVSILILRIDVAFPLRVPYEVEGKKWMINRVGLKDAVYNLAIGYPF